MACLNRANSILNYQLSRFQFGILNTYLNKFSQFRLNYEVQFLPLDPDERCKMSAGGSPEIIFSKSYYRLFPRVQRRINMDHFKDSCCRIRQYQNISTIKFDFSQKFLFHLSGIFLWSSKWKIKLHRRKSALNLQNKVWRCWHQF